MVLRKIYYLIILLLLSSCEMISAGHGSFNTYYFETSKEKLERAVNKVILNDKNIYREPPTSQEYKDIYKEVTKERNKEDKNGYIDTNYIDHYNDGKEYLTIKIINKNYKFTFRYYGDGDNWKKSSNSSFFIVYVYDEFKQGGGYKDKLDAKFIKKLTDIFEEEFVSKVEKNLGIKCIKKE